MSHGKIRAEKTCLNCGTPVPERFCPVCGQQNVEPRQSVGHLINHFFSDITHFDGKFFVTVKDLFRKPGFLSREYMKGRRVSYLDPIRMYIFTSAIFFIIFFSVFTAPDIHLGPWKQAAGSGDSTLDKVLARADNAEDSASVYRAFAAGPAQIRAFIDSLDRVRPQLQMAPLTPTHQTIAQYDSAQLAKPASKRDAWWKKLIKRRMIAMNEKYRDDRQGFIKEWLHIFIHNFPKLLFISLPAFALLLKLLYIRRKQFYYVDHGIFAVHLYIFGFLIMLVYFGVRWLEAATNWDWMGWIRTALVIFGLWYVYKAMRNFYQQRRAKTWLKYFLLLFFSLVIQCALFIVYLIFSLFEV